MSFAPEGRCLSHRKVGVFHTGYGQSVISAMTPVRELNNDLSKHKGLLSVTDKDGAACSLLCLQLRNHVTSQNKCLIRRTMIWGSELAVINHVAIRRKL